jgi:uncharacterized protein YfaT (DUF1175 family)
MLLALLVLAAPLASEAREDFLRRRVAEVALAQLARPDPRWEPAQRDCAGLVRFAYRAAFHQLWPARLAQPLWRDEAGAPAEFADARTLTLRSFRLLGRGDAARAGLRSGDLVAFSQQTEPGGEPEYHLMLAIVPPGTSPLQALVVYHPGAKGAAVRSGTLLALASEAPSEWRPVPENASFLGFYRFQEWSP